MTVADKILVGLVFFVAIADSIFAIQREQDTFSFRISSISRNWPIIPFAAGVLAGHLFFPNHAFC